LFLKFSIKEGQIKKNWRRYDVLNPISSFSFNFYAFLIKNIWRKKEKKKEKKEKEKKYREAIL